MLGLVVGVWLGNVEGYFVDEDGAVDGCCTASIPVISRTYPKLIRSPCSCRRELVPSLSSMLVLLLVDVALVGSSRSGSDQALPVALM